MPIDLQHPDPVVARAALEAVVAEIDRLEDEFSLFRPGSALSRLNRDGRLERPSLDMRRLLSEAQRFGALTDGVFDVTIQPLWLLVARHAARGEEPPPPALAAALALVDHRAKEGRCVFLQGGAAVLAQGSSETSGANVDSLRARFKAAGQDVAADAVLAAVATAWALGISPELIAAGLDTFVPELPQ